MSIKNKIELIGTGVFAFLASSEIAATVEEFLKDFLVVVAIKQELY
ncbi:MAG: hypothetical protein AAGF89_13645 [Bacteroidota bacterium]